ncbi:amphiregulin [Ambystoma mexicanum]|uniref:amphiregulin n=1 Tax=Ambystoma mexicanum TaxID=8296 RepID=UPI0037E857E0
MASAHYSSSSVLLLPRRLLLCTLLVSLACSYSALGSAVTGTETQNVTSPANHSSFHETELPSGQDYEEGEDDESEGDSLRSELIVDDLIQTQPVVKPENPRKKGGKRERKNGKSTKGKSKNERPKKLKLENICETTHKEFCIHGTCRFLEGLGKAACVCQHEYFGERCSEMYMKTKKGGDLSDTSTTALAVVAVLLSTISFIAIAIVIAVHMKKKYSTAYEGETEEKKKLGHENGDVYA